MRILITSLISLIYFNSVGQQTDSTYVPRYVSAFGGIYNELAAVEGDYAFSSGVEIAALVDEMGIFGLYATRLVSDVTRNFDTESGAVSATYNFWHSGIWTGIWFNSQSRLHAGIGLKLGVGRIKLIENATEIHNDQVYILNPEINLNWKANDWFKISAGFGLRMIKEIDDNPYRIGHSDLGRRPVITVRLLFGRF